MDFFNSLSQVAKNNHNFKKWEKDQRNENAKREELAKRRQHTPEELQKAKEYGATIVDVIDVMDNHSENVAENVETAVDPLSGLATLVGLFGFNWLALKTKSEKDIKAILNLRQEIENSDKFKNLEQKVAESLKGTDKPLGTFERILDQKVIRRIQDPDLKQELNAIKKSGKKQVIKHLKQAGYAHGLAMLGTVGLFVAATIYEAKLQTDSSKIARYQARKVLDDPKEFVTYTPEQIEAAKKELAEHPELTKKEKKSKLKSGMFKSIYNIIKDNKAYKQDKTAREDNSQKVTRELTPQERIQAEKDQEVIQRTVRIINNEAEKYSENMEVAANVIINGTPFLGAAVGAATGWILNKLKVFDKFVDSRVNKVASEETKELYKALKDSKLKGAKHHAKWWKFAKSMQNDITQNFKGKIKNIPVKDFAAIAMANRTGKQKLFGGVGALVTGFAGAILGLKLQKSAARAGRYTAKRELEKNPENFIGYSKEDYEEVKDVKTSEKKPNKFKEYALFIPNVIKQYSAYNKYKNKEYKERQALRELLKKQDVTPEQLREAKNLQRKLFNTFEKVDDNSQVYSESMEAATEIAQPFIQYGGILLALSPFIYTGVQVARGKITGAKLLDKVVTKLNNTTNLMQKKWFKKYLGHVEDNVSIMLDNVKIDGKKPLASLLKDIELQKDPMFEVFKKLHGNSKNALNSFRNLSNKEQISYLQKLENFVKQATSTNPQIKQSEIDNFFNVLKYGFDKNNKHINMTPELRANIMDMMFNPKNISPEEAEEARKALSLATTEELANTVHFFSPGLNEIFEAIGNINISERMAKLAERIIEITAQKNKGIVPLPKRALIILKRVLGEEDFNACLTRGSQVNIEDFLNKKIEAGAIVKPDEIIKGVGISPNEAMQLAKALGTKAKNATFKDAYNLASDAINPKVIIDRFKTHIEKMSPEKFAEFAEDRLHMSNMTKETMLGLLPKIQKVFENIPKDELDKITSKLVEEFNKRPDEMMALITSGKISKIFVTPQLRTALATAGISWAAFSIAMTYLAEAIMADMQLKAGRLGVMNAMKSLDDPAYYADIEPKATSSLSNTTSDNQSHNVKTVQNEGTTNLLDKLKRN